VATAEGEITGHANQGSGPNSDSSQFGSSYAVPGSFTLIVVVFRFYDVGRC